MSLDNTLQYNMTKKPNRIPAYHQMIIAISLLFFVSACSALAAPTPTPTATSTATVTASPEPTLPPTETSIPTETPTSTLTPTATDIPTETFTPTISPTPSMTPQPFTGFTFDNWEAIELPASIQDGIDDPLVLFINANDQTTIANIATAQPSTQIETIYFASPDNASARTEILQLPSSTGGQVYPSRAGNSLAYFKQDGAVTGLYVLNLENGFSARVLPLQSLLARGFNNTPSWEPTGERFAIALETGYDLDIFLIGRDGTGQTNLTDSGSQDWSPVWSPDGRYIAFLSDRDTCPSWRTGEENTCTIDNDPMPTSGTLHIINVVTGEITKISSEPVSEAPRWLNGRLLAFASGDTLDLLNPQRDIWLADVDSGTVTHAAIPDDTENIQYLSESWSPDGNRVLFQLATATDVELVLLSLNGQVLERTTDLSFPRFGMAASWSADGSRLAIGGVDGQCPYGIRVTDNDLESVARGNPPPSMCDPVFSPDGGQIAFTGVNPRVDGRIDVYTANFNGFGAVNLTVDLRGSIELIGWVGG